LANVEALINLNDENVPMGAEPVDALEDTRVNGKTGVTTTLWANVSFAVTFTLKYDHAPAPHPPVGGLPVVPTITAEELDTITEATLIVNFL
jgi:hypothetical protein